MATLDLRLVQPPAELLRRLPRRPGTFLLDGGAADSWGDRRAILGGEASAVLALPAGSGEDPFRRLEALADGGAAAVVCALGYDLGRTIEPIGPGPRSDLELPVLFAASHPWVLIHDRATGGYRLEAPGLDTGEIRRVAAVLEEAAAAPAPPPARRPRIDVGANFSRAAYCAAVRRVQEYIAAGDVYQVNLAQRLQVPFSGEPAVLFARLLAAHPAPWSAYVDGGDWALVSNSPECFLSRTGSRVSTLPIKGTRPRGADAAADEAMAERLLSSVKDAAEHVMIVDLERNDLGRVCRYGSIGVPCFRRLRSFASLHHLESEVAGELAPGTTHADLLRATFPGGSITGAPKIRAMQIIDELEPVGRGFYTGAIGILEPGGRLRLNVAIRTATVAAGRLSYHAGGGIVADSDPEDEYEETLVKAHAFLSTLHAEGP